MFLTSKNVQYFTNLLLHQPNGREVPIRCQLDSGASCNVISFKDLCVVTGSENPPYSSSTTRLKMFNNTTTYPLGHTRLYATVNNRKRLLHFEVMKDAPVTLLSGKTCEKLELIKFNEDELVHSVSKCE